MRTIISDAAIHWGKVAKEVADRVVRPLAQKYDRL